MIRNLNFRGAATWVEISMTPQTLVSVVDIPHDLAQVLIEDRDEDTYDFVSDDEVSCAAPDAL